MTRIPILQRDIPRGGYGRDLTSTERRDLRKHRASQEVVSNRAIVLRDHDSPSLGTVYNPLPGGGYGRTCHHLERP